MGESTDIVRTKGSIPRGRGRKRGDYTVTYENADDDTAKLCDVVVMIGVGTAMSRNDYDSQSELIASSNTTKPSTSIVSVVFDHNPNNIVKYGPNDYGNFYK